VVKEIPADFEYERPTPSYEKVPPIPEDEKGDIFIYIA
jgi:hypothetical protein